jgi:PrtD family type I secretion system ABC transporter
VADSKRSGRLSTEPKALIAVVLSSCHAAFLGIGLVSGVINLLMLTGAIFMMQVYDRVLGSQSIPTLVALSLIAIAAYTFQGWLDIIRMRVLALIGERIEGEVAPKVHAAVVDLPLRVPHGSHEPLHAFRQLDAIRGFVSGPGPVALFDMPWMPLYLGVCFMLHPLLGLLTLVGAGILVVLTLVTELRSKAPARAAMEAQSARNLAADAAQRGAEVVRAMGMLPSLAARWTTSHEDYLTAQRRANYVVGGLSATAKMFRMVLQSSLLGLGAYLAIRGQISTGTIIAASIIGARALAPIDLAIGSWKTFVSARQGYKRLKALLVAYPDTTPPFALPPPSKSLIVDGLTIAAPGKPNALVRRISLKLEAGQALGIIGPSASGKSTLGRALVGIWPPQAGKVALDGASLDRWTPEALGPSIGYLPQDVQLFDGTVAENIARFQASAEPVSVIEAATAAGFHEQVLALPEGYDTRVGSGGAQLSAGQKQRLGLARALFGRPFLVVLDEPNSNLDAEGEAAVSAAISGLRARGAIGVVIAHRPSAISAVDFILAMKGGEAVAFGKRDEVLGKTVQNARQILERVPARAIA